AFAAGMITGGRLGDIFGRKRMFMTGVVAFTLASLLCGLATGPEMLIASRVVQGLAASVMFPQVLAIMHVSFPEDKRAAVFAAIVLLVYPVIQGRDAGWPAWTWISMVASIPVFVAFVLWQQARKRRNGSPLIELRLFRQRAFSAGLFVSLLFWTAIASVFLVL